MAKNAQELDINKVVLFTKKEKVTLAFKAVSAELRDKVRFYIVYIPEKNPPADLVSLAESYNATDLPKLLVEQTYDNEFDKTVLTKHVVYEGKSFKYLDMLEFMSKYARSITKEETEQQEQQKEDQQTEEETKQADIPELDADSFDAHVTSTTDGCIVYFTTLAKDQVVSKEYKYYNLLLKHFLGPIRVATFRLHPDNENYETLKKQFKVSKLEVGKPELRYYPNEVAGQQKLDKSYSLPLELDNKDMSRIMEDVESTFQSNIVDIQGHLFNNYIMQYAKDEQKHVVYYMYRDEQQLSLAFKHISNHALFKDECVFLAMKDPPMQLFQGLRKEMMPSIGFIPRLDESFKEGKIEQANMDASQSYPVILKWIAQ